MRSALYLLFSFLLINTCRADTGEEKIPGILQRIDSASIAQDKVAAIEIMKSLDQHYFWSFGAGLGPTTNDSLRIKAIESLWSVYSNLAKTNQPLGAPSHLTKIRDMVNGGEDQWKDGLKSPDPAVRLIVLLVITGKKDLSDDLTAALKHLSETDDYYQIVRASKDSPQKGLPPPPGLVSHVTSAPLRERARAELAKRGVPGVPREKVTGDEAARWLATLLLKDGIPSADVSYGIDQLDDDTGLLKMLKSTAAQKDPSALSRKATQIMKETEPEK